MRFESLLETAKTVNSGQIGKCEIEEESTKLSYMRGFGADNIKIHPFNGGNKLIKFTRDRIAYIGSMDRSLPVGTSNCALLLFKML